MAEARGPQSIECGFCYQTDKDIQDPRVLPCSHIFCRGCLAGQLEHLKVIRCPPCSKVFDVVVDDLPTYKPDAPKHKCDVCTKKGKGDQPAVMYCNSCTKKFCEGHQEAHDDVHEDHVTLTITEYVEQADRLETRHCTEHRDEVCRIGCGGCLKVFCTKCDTSLNVCDDGKPHKLLHLGDLVSRLTEDIDKLREDMMCKEEKLSALFKKTSKYISEYEKETKEMIEKLHETRDQQIKAIQTKYKKLEEELIKTRKETRAEMMLFMEEEVGNNLTNLANRRMRIEARLRNNHVVDIVNTYRDTQAEATKLSDGQLPVLSLDNVKTLRMRDMKRELDAEIVPVGRINIGCDPVLSVTSPPKSLYLVKSVASPPKSLSLVKYVTTHSFCHSVCHYNGKTYVGTQNWAIGVVGSDYMLEGFISLAHNHWPYGITIYQNKVYALITSYNNASTINVYGISGMPMSKWNRNDKCHLTRPAIVSNKIVVPDNKGKQLSVYSLTEQLVKRIPCPNLSGEGTAACAVDENSVIVTSYRSSLVFRVDIIAGQTVWSSNDVTNPQATAMCGKDLVCIASEKKITFLNANTGKVVSQMAAPDISNGEGFNIRCIDIDIHDNTLIVSTAAGGYKVLYYQLN